jgi:hypothetical protein
LLLDRRRSRGTVTTVERPAEAGDGGRELSRNWFRPLIEWRRGEVAGDVTILPPTPNTLSESERVEALVIVTPQNELGECAACGGKLERVPGPGGVESFRGAVMRGGLIFHELCEGSGPFFGLN